MLTLKVYTYMHVFITYNVILTYYEVIKNTQNIYIIKGQSKAKYKLKLYCCFLTPLNYIAKPLNGSHPTLETTI